MKTEYSKDLKGTDFFRILGETKPLLKECLSQIEQYNFKYRTLKVEERDEVFLLTLKEMDIELLVSGPSRLLLKGGTHYSGWCLIAWKKTSRLMLDIKTFNFNSLT